MVTWGQPSPDGFGFLLLLKAASLFLSNTTSREVLIPYRHSPSPPFLVHRLFYPSSHVHSCHMRHSTADFFFTHLFSLVIRYVFSLSFAFCLSPSSQFWTRGYGLQALVFDSSLVWGRSNASMIAPTMGQGLCPSCLLLWVVFSWVLCCSMEMSKIVGQRTFLNSCPMCKFPSPHADQYTFLNAIQTTNKNANCVKAPVHILIVKHPAMSKR